MEYTFYKIYSNPDNLSEFTYWIIDEGGKRNFQEAKFMFWWDLKGQPAIIIESGHPAIDIINDVPTLNIANKLSMVKDVKVSELEAAYLAWQNAGWTDSVSGYTLFLSDKDKINYTQLKSIIFDEPDGTICEIGTTTGWQSMEKTILYDMLVRYGKAAFATYKKLSDLIIYVNFIAQTEAEVNAISW